MKISGGSNWELDLKGMLRFEEVHHHLLRCHNMLKSMQESGKGERGRNDLNRHYGLRFYSFYSF